MKVQGGVQNSNQLKDRWRNHQHSDPHPDGVGERGLDLVMVFCHHNQAKMEASDALSALCQCNSSEPSVVAVRRYSNTLYIPQGMICSLYLDVGTFSGGVTLV